MVNKIILKYVFVYTCFAVGSTVAVALLNEGLSMGFSQPGVLAISFIVLYLYILYTSIKSAVANYASTQRLMGLLKSQNLKAYTLDEDAKLKEFKDDERK